MHKSPARWLLLGLGLLAGVSLVVEFGFVLEERTTQFLERLDAAIAVLFGLELVVDVVVSRFRSVRDRWYEYLLLFLFLLAIGGLHWLAPPAFLEETLEALQVRSVARLYLILIQVFVLFGAGVHFLRGQERLLSASIHPGRLFAAGFAGLVLLGTLLLLLPRVSADPSHPISIADAFFTSMSAVCVTGLAVRDTGADFSTFGQLILVGLFQVGGLGIITFVGFLSVVSGKGFSVPQMVALREIVNAPTLGGVRRQILVLIGTAVAIETVGAVILYQSGACADPSWIARMHWAVFHSVSAFCNAGFALSSDSLVGLRSDAVVNFSIIGLIIVGGLGAPVVSDVASRVGARVHGRGRAQSRRRLTAQTRISLIVTGMLILVGFAGFLVLQMPSGEVTTSLGERLQVALFQSVTTRTAGFNSVDIGSLRDTTLLLLIGLMIVGASPVSTGGGIKTVAFGVLLLTMRSMVTGRRVEAFGRSIPERVVRASISIFLLYLFTASLVVFLLSFTDPDVLFLSRLFETVSALSTVGLSTGITPELSAGGKLILCATMFAGRIGPLTLAMTIFRSSRRTAPYDLPEEAMVLG